MTKTNGSDFNDTNGTKKQRKRSLSLHINKDETLESAPKKKGKSIKTPSHGDYSTYEIVKLMDNAKKGIAEDTSDLNIFDINNSISKVKGNELSFDAVDLLEIKKKELNLASPKKEKKTKTVKTKQPIKTVERSSLIQSKTNKKHSKKPKSPLNHNLRIPGSESECENDVVNIEHSVSKGQKMFDWLIHPINRDVFLKITWERKPLHIPRKNVNYYDNITSMQQIDSILREQRLEFTKNIDITSYKDGVRETHNPVGRAMPAIVWDYYLNDCSVRVLNPQSYIPKIHELSASLQEYFGCFVGCNSYLTPPDSQGFAPHYDDIEAFVLQIEGRKHWKVYAPRFESEVLPRESSINFTPEVIPPKPLLDITLNPGDLLYFPRGFIHQASTVAGEHSLHLTMSVYQKNSWADLLEKVVPAMLTVAIEEEKSLREGLPLDISSHLGLVHSDKSTARRDEIVTKLKSLLNKIIEYAPIDGAVDQFCKDYQHSALPPVLDNKEIVCSVFGTKDSIENGHIIKRCLLTPSTKIRLTRANILRMLMEEETIRLYHHMENTKVYQETEPQYIEISENQAAAMEILITTYPNFVAISKLPFDDSEYSLEFTKILWDKGLVITDTPLIETEIDE